MLQETLSNWRPQQAPTTGAKLDLFFATPALEAQVQHIDCADYASLISPLLLQAAAGSAQLPRSLNAHQ
jgi:hypothetical protein